MSRIILIMLFLVNICTSAFAAIGCSLDDPDRDVQRIFPQSSGYKTIIITLKEIGGQALQKQVEERLGDRFDTVYESLDVPYAYYTVLKGKDVIGYVHGINQKGKFGILQLVAAIDTQGRIMALYYQKISSPEAARFKDSAFTDKFRGLSLEDFTKYDVSGKNTQEGRVSQITDPSLNSQEDFRATLRGIKKDLILLDVFINGQKNEGGK